MDNSNILETGQKAIIHCSHNGIRSHLSFEEVNVACEKISQFLSELSGPKNEGIIAIFANHNIYLLPLIKSLKSLKIPFIFLSGSNGKSVMDKLKIKWVLTFQPVEDLLKLKMEGELKIGNASELFLWSSNNVPNFIGYDIFCVVLSSGTTGENKIIQVPYSCIETNVLDLKEKFELSRSDIIFWGTPLTFDPTFIELLLAIETGACLLIVQHSDFVNQNYLHHIFMTFSITFYQVVPSVFLRWSDNQIEDILNNSKLRIIAFGGEEFPSKVLKFKRKPNLRLFNLYGITELSCWAAIHELSSNVNPVPLGEPLSEVNITVVDHGEVISNGNGEIYLSSNTRFCIVDGVRNNKQPVGTGDIAHINNGKIFYQGRKNRLIKRFGIRVNLKTVEEKIWHLTGLMSKCVWSEKHKKLLLFLQTDVFIDIALKNKSVDKVHSKLLHSLPEEAFPDFLDFITKFPLNHHGKINEKSLVKIYENSKLEIENPNTCDVFSDLVCKYFGIPCENFSEIMQLTFFEIGGSSILAMQLLTELKEQTKCDYPEEFITALFESDLETCLKCLSTKLRQVHKRTSLPDDYIATKHIKLGKSLTTKWTYNLKACVDTSPVLFKNRETLFIAVGSFSHMFVVLNENGDEVYKKIFPDVIESTSCISPCKTFLFVGCFNGVMYCISYQKNEIVWEFCTGDRIKATACYTTNDTVIFGSYDQNVYCLGSKDGHCVWKIKINGRISSNVLYFNSKVYVSTTKGYCYCLRETTGSIVWQYETSVPIFGTPCIVDNSDCLVWPAVDGTLHCTSLSGHVLWKFYNGAHLFSSLVCKNNVLYFGSHDSNIHILKVDGVSCEIIRKVKLDSPISTTPFITDENDKLVGACNTGYVYLIDLKSFEITHSYKFSSEVFSSPVMYNNRIYVGCRDNFLYCMNVE